MIKSKEMRKITRSNLKGNWGQAIGVVISYFFIAWVVKLILENIVGTAVATLIGEIILAPLIFGVYYYQLKLAKKENKYGNLYEMFTNKVIWKSMIVQIIYMIGLCITSIIIIGAMVGAQLSTHQNNITPQKNVFLQSPITVFIVFMLAIVILIVMGIPAIIYCYTYSQIIFVLVENEDISIREVFRSSRLMMRGNKWRLFRLQITFIWWGFLSVITIFIGLIWLAPYYSEAMAVFHNEINVNKVKETIGYTEL